MSCKRRGHTINNIVTKEGFGKGKPKSDTMCIRKECTQDPSMVAWPTISKTSKETLKFCYEQILVSIHMSMVKQRSI